MTAVLHAEEDVKMIVTTHVILRAKVIAVDIVMLPAIILVHSYVQQLAAIMQVLAFRFLINY